MRQQRRAVARAKSRSSAVLAVAAAERLQAGADDEEGKPKRAKTEVVLDADAVKRHAEAQTVRGVC